MKSFKLSARAKRILQWCAAVFCFMGAITEIGVSSLFLTVAGVLFLPVKNIRSFLMDKMKIRGFVACLIAIPFFFIGMTIYPTDNTEDNSEIEISSSSILASSEEESSLEEIITSSKEESSLEEIIESSKEESSLEEIIESSKEESSLEEVIESSEEESSLEEIIESSEEESSLEEIIESSKEESSSEEIIESSKEESSSEEIIESSEEEFHLTYILNTNSKKIHYPSCGQTNRISAANKEETDKSLEELLADGYTTCKTCFK